MLKNSFDLKKEGLYQVVTVVRPSKEDYRVIGNLLKAGYHAVPHGTGVQLEKLLKGGIKV